jgi:phosphatidate cytidylyltransferase
VNAPNQNLVARLASAVVLLPLVVWLVYLGGVPCAILLALAAAACVGEYLLITRPRPDWGTAGALLLGGTMPVWPFVLPFHAPEAALGTLVVAFFWAWVHPLLRGPLSDAPTRAAHLFTGVAYGGLGLYSIAGLRAQSQGLGWVIAALTVTWANDTLAYFAGRLFGRHKLYPEVSPNKTWEGFAGGLVGSVLGLFVARAVYVSALTPLDCVVLGTLGGVLGPLGDLSESMLKRAYGVKDSSRLIPGHGGVLDRIDALLFNGPLVYVYVRLVHGGV